MKSHCHILIYTVLLAVASMMLSGCSSSKKMVTDPIYDVGKQPVQTTKQRSTNSVAARPTKKESAVSLRNLDASSKALVEEALSWLGTRYSYGGESKAGVDCSGLIMQVYLNAAKIKLPRTTSEQRNFCSKISQDKLLVGDLIFFTSKKARGDIAHVGLYVGDNRMIHASSSRGVILSDLAEDYYTTYYHSAGRVGTFAKKSKNNSTKKIPEINPQRAAEQTSKPKQTITVSLSQLDDILSQKTDSIYNDMFD